MELDKLKGLSQRIDSTIALSAVAQLAAALRHIAPGAIEKLERLAPDKVASDVEADLRSCGETDLATLNQARAYAAEVTLRVFTAGKSAAKPRRPAS